jgi:hypothetical protein
MRWFDGKCGGRSSGQHRWRQPHVNRTIRVLVPAMPAGKTAEARMRITAHGEGREKEKMRKRSGGASTGTPTQRGAGVSRSTPAWRQSDFPRVASDLHSRSGTVTTMAVVSSDG